MRGAIWMALALVGTPLGVMAQQNTGASTQTQTAASPSGAATVSPTQDPGNTGFYEAPNINGSPSLYGSPNIFGQPSNAGTMSPTGFSGVPWPGGYQPGSTGLAGGEGTGGAGLISPTYRGTTPEIPSATPSTSTSTPGSTGSGVTPSPTTPPPASGTMGTGTGGTVGGQASMDELTFLRQRVAVLERELGTLRGTGGSGTNGPVTAAPAADPSVGTIVLPANTEVTSAETTSAVVRPAGSDANAPVTVATAVFDGKVRKVTSRHIDIVDSSDGSLYRLTLDKDTKVFRGPRLTRIRATQLSEGTTVRASFALVSGEERAQYIVAKPRKVAARGK